MIADPEAAGSSNNPALLRSAMAMVDDPAAARALVALTLDAAREAEGRGSPPGDAELFRLLRQAYHSIERSHSPRRMRDALATTSAREDG